MVFFNKAATRFRQFYRAVTASVNQDDLSFLDKYLSSEEKALFFQMDIADQRHALDVAYYAYPAATARGLGTRRTAIVKAALLHDIGKVQGTVSLPARVLYVLFPSYFARSAKSTWRVLRRHAQRGAYMAEIFGSEPEVVELIRRHHEQSSDDFGVLLLQEADSVN